MVTCVWCLIDWVFFFCHLYPLFSVPLIFLSSFFTPTCPSLHTFPLINLISILNLLLILSQIHIFLKSFSVSHTTLPLHQPPSLCSSPRPPSRWQSSPWPAPFCVRCSPTDRGHGVGFPGKVSALPWHFSSAAWLKSPHCNCCNCICFHLYAWVCLPSKRFTDLCITVMVFSPRCGCCSPDTKIAGSLSACISLACACGELYACVPHEWMNVLTGLCERVWRCSFFQSACCQH